MRGSLLVISFSLLGPIVSVLLDVQEPAFLVQDALYDILVHPGSHHNDQNTDDSQKQVGEPREVGIHTVFTDVVGVGEGPVLEEFAIEQAGHFIVRIPHFNEQFVHLLQDHVLMLLFAVVEEEPHDSLINDLLRLIMLSQSLVVQYKRTLSLLVYMIQRACMAVLNSKICSFILVLAVLEKEVTTEATPLPKKGILSMRTTSVDCWHISILTVAKLKKKPAHTGSTVQNEAEEDDDEQHEGRDQRVVRFAVLEGVPQDHHHQEHRHYDHYRPESARQSTASDASAGTSRSPS